MDLARELAVMCVDNSMEKKADQLSDLRTQFDESALNEGVLRRHADRLKTLADRRAAREDTTLGGYADTAVGRMLPIPKNLGEAAWRLPAIATGAGLGHVAGQYASGTDLLGIREMMSRIDPNEAKSTLSGEGGAGIANALKEREIDRMGRQRHSSIMDEIRRENEAYRDQVLNNIASNNPTYKIRPEHIADIEHPNLPAHLKAYKDAWKIKSRDIEELTKQLGASDVNTLGAILQKSPSFLKNRKAEAAAQVLRQSTYGSLGTDGVKFLREEIKNAIKNGKPAPGAFGKLVSQVEPYPLIGTAAGALGATALTGLPLALKAVFDKHRGGSDAVRARSEMRKTLRQAEAEARKREAIIGKASPKPKSTKEAAIKEVPISGRLLDHFRAPGGVSTNAVTRQRVPGEVSKDVAKYLTGFTDFSKIRGARELYAKLMQGKK